MPTSELRTKEQLLAEMSRLVNTDNFNMSRRDAFDRVKLLFDIVNSSDVSAPTYDRWHRRTDPGGIVELRRRCHEELRRDPAALEFFSRSAHNDQPVVSDYGTKLTKQAYVVNGRPVGKVVQMRTYSVLDTWLSGDAGGFSAPILFWQQVTATLKQIDELFLAVKWIDTPTGGTFDLPLADDISNVARNCSRNHRRRYGRPESSI